MVATEPLANIDTSFVDPSRWETVRFGDVVRNVNDNERDPEAAGIESYVGLEHIDPESLRIARWGLVTDGTSFTRVFRKGQVLFGKRRAYQRKVAVAEWDGICSGDILVFEPKDDRLLPELLPFIVQSDGFFDHALGTSAGSLSPRTRWKDLAAYEFALPPKDEQRRIAELLQASIETVEKLKWLRETLFQAKQALVTDWLGVGGTQANEGWQTVRIADLARDGRQCVQVGPFGGSLASRHFTQSGTPVLKIQNLTDGGTLDLRSLVYVAPEYAKTLSRYAVEPGDLLTAAQATTGRSALVTQACSGALVSQHLIRVAVDATLCLPEFLLACFTSSLILKQIDAVKAKTTRDGLNTDDVENFRIPLPPIDDQMRLVQAIDAFDESANASLLDVQQSSSLTRRISRLLLAGDRSGQSNVQ